MYPQTVFQTVIQILPTNSLHDGFFSNTFTNILHNKVCFTPAIVNILMSLNCLWLFIYFVNVLLLFYLFYNMLVSFDCNANIICRSSMRMSTRPLTAPKANTPPPYKPS